MSGGGDGKSLNRPLIPEPVNTSESESFSCQKEGRLCQEEDLGATVVEWDLADLSADDSISTSRQRNGPLFSVFSFEVFRFRVLGFGFGTRPHVTTAQLLVRYLSIYILRKLTLETSELDILTA